MHRLIWTLTLYSLIKIESSNIFLNSASETIDDKTQIAEAVAKRYSVKIMFLKISQSSQENLCG